jgi:uncharacterized protein (TIGR02466 family)
MNNNFWDYSFEQPKTELNSVHNIFPTALFESTISISNKDEIIKDLYSKYSKSKDYKIEKSIGNYLINTEESLEKNKISFYTEDTLHENPIYFELRSQIEIIAQKIFDTYSYKNISPRIETMWGNVLGHSGYIHPHSHSNSMFAGVWYPEDPPHVSENSLSNHIRFIDPTRIKYFFMPQIEHKNQINSGEIYIKPRKGMCLIFPSWLEHDTVPNENPNEVRYSISFNIFFNGTLGFPNSLNRLTI